MTLRRLLCLICIAILLSSCRPTEVAKDSEPAAKPVLAMLSTSDGPVTDLIQSGSLVPLSRQNIRFSDHFELVSQTGRGDAASISFAAREIADQNPRLTIAIGASAYNAIRPLFDGPIVAVLRDGVDDVRPHPKTYSVVYRAPIGEVLTLAREAAGEGKVGLLTGIGGASLEDPYFVESEPITSAAAVDGVLENFKGQGTRVVVLSNDRIVEAFANEIIASASRHRLALLTPYPLLTTSGATGGIGPDVPAIGLAAGRMVADLWHGRTPPEQRLEVESRLEAWNEVGAKELGIVTRPASLGLGQVAPTRE